MSAVFLPRRTTSSAQVTLSTLQVSRTCSSGAVPVQIRRQSSSGIDRGPTRRTQSSGAVLDPLKRLRSSGSGLVQVKRLPSSGTAQIRSALHVHRLSSSGSVLPSTIQPTRTPSSGADTLHQDAGEHHDKVEVVKGRIAGGKYLAALDEEQSMEKSDGPLVEVDFDLPLTLTGTIQHDGHEVILLDFAPGDKENPLNWPILKKRMVTAILCGMTLTIGLATTAYSSGIGSMVSDLGVSVEIGQLGLFLFNFVCALAPLFLAPFCEMVGRRTIYVGAYLCFGLMFIGLALGKNIATILVCRALLGLFGCVGTILVGGTFDDMFVPEERARPMGIFSYIAILGTVAAPVYAGFIDMTIGWRWIQGIQGLSTIPLLIISFFFLPETRGAVTLQKRAKMIHHATGDDRYISVTDLDTTSWKDKLHASSVMAIQMLVTEPVVFAFGLWIAFAWGVTFLFLSVIPIAFLEKRGWNEGVGGLPYIALCLGATFGFMGDYFQQRKYKSIIRDPTRNPLPEHRLYGAMFGAIWLPVGLFIFSFTQYGYIHWIAPMISLVLIAVGIFFIFESVYSYTCDCYGDHSSSAIAGQGFFRNTLGAVTPLFASQFFHNVGSQYAGLILALVATILSVLPFVMFKYGHILRARSKLAHVYGV